MARRATGIANKPAAARTTRAGGSARGVAEASGARRTIPLNLAPLLAPYKKHGRLSLRIERLPRLARLSRGRNNGDSSWSLTLDELEDLAYLPPDGVDAAHTLVIRIVSLDGSSGTTLAVLDFLVSSNTVEDEGHSPNVGPVEPDDNTQLCRLRNELAEAKATLAARESDLSKARQEAGQPEKDVSRPKTTTEPDTESIGSPPAGIFAAKGEALPSMVAPPSTQPGAPPDSVAQRDHGNEIELHRLREEHTALKAVLADRETALVEARVAAEQARERAQREAEDALSKAEQAWRADEAARLAAAQAHWRESSSGALSQARAETELARNKGEGALRRMRDECTALQAALADREAELARADIAAEQASERAQREAEDALSKARKAWAADEATRLAAAEAQWREKSAREVAAAAARYQQAEAALIDLRTQADTDVGATRDKDDRDVRRLRDEWARMQAALTDRDNALAQMRSATEQARDTWQKQSEAALSKAATAWKTDEAARLAAAEAQWRKQSASALAEATARCERAEMLFAEASARADVAQARDRENSVELHSLRSQCTAFQTALADRESALAQARIAAEQAGEHAQREAENGLSKAKKAWAADEAARLAATEAQWQEQFKRTSAQARAAAEAASDQLDGELRRLRDEFARTQETLGDRDSELVQVRSAAEKTRERWQRETQAAVQKAERSWKAAEAGRFAAAQAEWRKQSARALADATARFEAGEPGLAQMRAEVDAARDNIEISRLRDELAASHAALADREIELAHARSGIEQSDELTAPETRIVIRSNRAWDTEGPLEQQRFPAAKRRAIGGFVMAAALFTSVLLFYPSIERFVPKSWSSSIAGLTAGKAPIASAESASPPAGREPTALVVQSVNLRAGPSSTAPVISTVQRGQEVATLEQRGNWTHVRIDGDGKTQPREGWVYRSFLKDAGDRDKNSPTAAAK